MKSFIADSDDENSGKIQKKKELIKVKKINNKNDNNNKQDQ